MANELPQRSKIGRLMGRQLEKATSSVFSGIQRRRLCQICQGLRFDDLRSGKTYTHSKPEEIVASARAGCPLCSLLSQYFDLEPASLRIQLYGIRRRLSNQEKASLVEEGDIEALGVRNGYDRDMDNPFVHKLALYTPHDDIAASVINRRPAIKDFASEECFRLIKSWIDACVFHHPGCTSPVISQLPTRVIDVGMRGGQQDPFLFSPPKGYKDSYVALSYCWGRVSTRFVLTKEKALLPKPTFPFNILPKTLRDAIHITQKLGFRFLWIDSLCIIQEGDDGEDFRRESVTMHEVYGNATLTIAAAAASSVDEGIFRKLPFASETECQMSYDLPDGRVGTAFVEFEEAEKGGSRLRAPLNTRGWTFQERILSPRVILFYEDQLGWDCTSTLINSNGPLNPLLNYNLDSPGRLSDYVTQGTSQSADSVTENSQRTELGTFEDQKNQLMTYWRVVVEFYSRRQLTNPDDKLKAISGLAQLIKLRTHDSYIAGVWRSDTIRELFWFSEDPNSKRQSSYRAPSWSWASMNSSVKFLLPSKLESMFSWSSMPELSRFYIEDLSITQRDGDTALGDVLSCRIQIRGQLQRWKHHDVPMQSRSKTDAIIGLEGAIFFDEKHVDEADFGSKDGPSEYYFFSPGVSKNFCALILKPFGSAYRRVGFCRFDLGHWPPEQGGPSDWTEPWNENNITSVIIE